MTFEHNKKLALRYLREILGGWKFDIIPEVMHESYTLSDSSVSLVVNDADSLHGLDAFRNRVEKMKIGMPDMQFRILKTIAEPDAAIAWWSWEGTQTGPFFGFPPKGRHMKIFGTMFFEIRDEKIASTLVNFDTFNFLIQLGHATVKTNEDQLISEYLKNLEQIGQL